jgi:tetratricopeptide (TPR) repeat protein
MTARLHPSARTRRPGLGLAFFALATLLACQGASIEEIRALQDSGSYEESIEPLRGILAAQPDDAEANYRLGLAFVRTGRANLALWPLRKAAETEPFAKDAGVLLAATLAELDNFEEAIRTADRVIESDPENLSALVTRARATLAAHLPQRALEDSERVLALDPKNVTGHVAKAGALIELGRVDDAERAFTAYRQAMADQGDRPALEACLTEASFIGKIRDDVERSERALRACLDEYPHQVTDLQTVVGLLDSLNRAQQATALLHERAMANPSDLDTRALLAMRLSSQGRAAEADALLLETVRDSTNPGGWEILAGVRRDAGNLAGAREALEKAIEFQPQDDEGLRFRLADLLVDLGELERAEEMAKAFREQVYRDLIGARITLERGDPAAALKQIEPALLKWPNNDGARMVAARAASELGDTERAMSELREATRVAPERNEAALILARYYLAQGKYAEAFTFASRHQNKKGFTGPEVALIRARAELGLGKPDDARKSLDALHKVPGQEAAAIAELARLELSASGRGAAVRAIEKSGLDLSDPANEPALRQLVELRFAGGEDAKAVALLADLVRRRPGSAGLQAVQGQVLLRTGRAQEAQAAFARALEQEPNNAPALAGKGMLTIQQGNPGEAGRLFEQASAAAPNEPLYPYLAAAAVRAEGRLDEAEKRLREVVHRYPEFAPAANDLALLLAEKNESLDFAASLADRARRLLGGPEVLDTVGFVELRRGKLDLAQAALEEALASNPGYATARYHLGLVLAARGEKDAAIAALRQALGGGPFPEAEAARTQLAALESGRGVTQ